MSLLFSTIKKLLSDSRKTNKNTYSVKFGKLAYTMTSEHKEQTNISITVIVANFVVKTPSFAANLGAETT